MQSEDQSGVAADSHPAPILILGIMQRSGTNFLSSLLCLHPDCYAGSVIWEDFVVAYSDLLVRYANSLYKRWNPAWRVDEIMGPPDALCAHLGDGVLSFLNAQASSKLARTTPVRRGPSRNGTIWLPLTAGYDSRVLLTVSSFLGLGAITYTQAYDRMKLADRVLPAQLAREAGYRHRLIPKRSYSSSALRLCDYHTAGHIMDRNRLFFAHGQWEFAHAGDVVLRGNCFEVGRCYYWRHLPGPSAAGAQMAATAIASAFGEPAGSSAVAGLAEWLQWRARAPVPGLDWRDRFYIKQRLAGWMSAAEQSLDLVHPESYLTTNCSRFFALLLRVPPERRMRAEHHTDLIERLAPELLRFPFNPPDESFGRLTRLRIGTLRDPLDVPKRILLKVKRWFRRGTRLVTSLGTGSRANGNGERK